MCIALLTTRHPSYALIVLNNRDEFVLRPTSSLAWWSPASNPHNIRVLSSRDLQRPQKGTWLGLTATGHFAVLTNYKETDLVDELRPVDGKRSRGTIPLEWLLADPAERTEDFVKRMLENGYTKGVGGFSLLCGKLRRGQEKVLAEPLRIVTNRNDELEKVASVLEGRGQTCGLSNTTFVAEEMGDSGLLAKTPIWPKVAEGQKLLDKVVDEAVRNQASENEFMASLFRILETDRLSQTFPATFDESIAKLKTSIFIPSLGTEKQQEEQKEFKRRRQNGEAGWKEDGLNSEGLTKGLYGTQRQTIILVGWDGEVSYVERRLWDEFGDRTKEDSGFRFKIEGWEV